MARTVSDSRARQRNGSGGPSSGRRRANVDVDRVAAPVFAIAEDLEPFASEWHAHRRHQLLYSASGTLRLEVSGRQWLLPPQKAAFIRSNVRHRASSEQPTLLRTLYFDVTALPDLPALHEHECIVFPVSALVRELILYAMRWDGQGGDELAFGERLFGVCAELCAELAAAPQVLWLPTGQSPEIQRAIAHTLSHLDQDLRQADVAQAAGVSERSLARRFPEETQMTWLRFLQSARLLRATELLSAPRARVTETAFAVGFESLAAFTRAFERFTGETPKEYRKRMQASEGAARPR